jgi:hypothetical protein
MASLDIPDTTIVKADITDIGITITFDSMYEKKKNIIRITVGHKREREREKGVTKFYFCGERKLTNTLLGLLTGVVLPSSDAKCKKSSKMDVVDFCIKC